MVKQKKFPVKQTEHSFKKSSLVAPINALDEKTAMTLYGNQEILFEHLIWIKRQVISIKRELKKEMREEIEKKIVKNLDGKVHMIDSALTHSMVLRKILEEKGKITREEINKKYEELGIKK